MPFPFIGPRTPGNACTFLLRVTRQRFSSVNREVFDYEFFFFFETTLREDCFAIATKDVLNFVEMTRFYFSSENERGSKICIFKDNHISISFFSSGIQSKYKWPLINWQRRRALFFVGLKRIGSKIYMCFSFRPYHFRTDLIFLCESIVSPILLFARDPI